MASITTNAKGFRRLLFTWNGRRTLYLGKLALKTAESLKSLVETLIAHKSQGVPLDLYTSNSVKQLGDDLHQKLVDLELVTARPKSSDLLTFVDDYIAHRTDWKPNSRRNAEQARRYLSKFFTKPVNLDTITEHDAKAYRRWLTTQVGENTTRRNCKWASQFFRNAVDRRLIDRNPFACLRGLSMRDEPERQHYVSREIADRILDACPTLEWKLIFALSRYGGLRCPSETTALRWTDIDWEKGRITVDSPKTGLRQVPLFPELYPLLLEASEQAADGATHIVNRATSANLRTNLHRIMKRVGVKPWAKVFQNLRSTRETELAEQYPLHVVCKWIGNSQPVAMKHYLQVTDEHWGRATDGNGHSLARGSEDTREVAQLRRP